MEQTPLTVLVRARLCAPGPTHPRSASRFRQVAGLFLLLQRGSRLKAGQPASVGIDSIVPPISHLLIQMSPRSKASACYRGGRHRHSCFETARRDLVLPARSARLAFPRDVASRLDRAIAQGEGRKRRGRVVDCRPRRVDFRNRRAVLLGSGNERWGTLLQEE
jgi:hypothetical protein